MNGIWIGVKLKIGWGPKLIKDTMSERKASNFSPQEHLILQTRKRIPTSRHHEQIKSSFHTQRSSDAEARD